MFVSDLIWSVMFIVHSQSQSLFAMSQDCGESQSDDDDPLDSVDPVAKAMQI